MMITLFLMVVIITLIISDPRFGDVVLHSFGDRYRLEGDCYSTIAVHLFPFYIPFVVTHCYICSVICSIIL